MKADILRWFRRWKEKAMEGKSMFLTNQDLRVKLGVSCVLLYYWTLTPGLCVCQTGFLALATYLAFKLFFFFFFSFPGWPYSA